MKSLTTASTTAGITLTATLLASTATVLGQPANPINESVIGYLWANDPNVASYTPNETFSYNASGGGVEITRESVGLYSINFMGLGRTPEGGNVQVTSYGETSERCSVLGWGFDDGNLVVNVQCYDVAGDPADTIFSGLVIWPEEGAAPEGVAYAWASQPEEANYAPSDRWAYNGSGGDIQISRSAVGEYLVTFSGMGSIGDTGGHVQVTAYGDFSGLCKSDGWGVGGDDIVASVDCYDAAGDPADAPYSILFLSPQGAVPGMGFTWADQAGEADYVPATSWSYNGAGGPVSISRSGVGSYIVEFDKLGSEDIAGGNVQVTSYGGGSEACNVVSWSSSDEDFLVQVDCRDAAGDNVDTRYDVLVTWPDSPLPSYADAVIGHAWIDDPTADAYTITHSFVYNASGDNVEVTRFGEGSHLVTFAGLGSDGGDPGGHVQVTPYGGNHICAIDSWGSSDVDVQISVFCNTPAGDAIDAQFTVAFLWPQETIPTLAYVWADEPEMDEYEPDERWAYNGAGQAVPITRNGPGDYVVTFEGMGTSPNPGGNAQVSAYGEAGITCTVGGWFLATDDINADVDCSNTSGMPADSRFTLLLSWPQEGDPAVGYVWGNDPNAENYVPEEAFTYNGAGDGVEITRSAAGTYQVRFENLGGGGLGGNVQVTAYDHVGNCNVESWDSSSDDFTINVVCLDEAGDRADARFSLLMTWPDRTTATSTEGPNELPAEEAFDVTAVYPNPTSGRATVAFSTPEDGRTTVELYDVTGRKVAVVFDGEQTAGRHLLNFEIGNLPGGSYIAVLRVRNGTTSRKFALVR